MSTVPSFKEAPQATWDKRYKQTHYSYRDSLIVPVTPTIPTPYMFGANARLISVYNWPMMGDWADALNTYARQVWVYATKDTFISLISLNPRYLILLAQQEPVIGIPTTITEQPQLIPAGGSITFNPTYAIGILYYGAAAGALVVNVEGNTEGTE
jgi:hypothetical protein